jgi:hypothetical protein
MRRRALTRPESMSSEEYLAYLNGEKAPENKYGAIKCEEDGYTFDSLAERRRYRELKQLRDANMIVGIEVHPTFQLTGFSGIRFATYSADFAYIENGEYVVEDVKSKATAGSNFRRNAMMIWDQYGIMVRQVTSRGEGFEITPAFKLTKEMQRYERERNHEHDRARRDANDRERERADARRRKRKQSPTRDRRSQDDPGSEGRSKSARRTNRGTGTHRARRRAK